MTAIIISWVVLAVCFIIKIFGGQIFNIATTNATFIKVCAFVDNHLWLQNIIAFVTNLLAVSLLNLAVLKQKVFKWKQFILVILSTAIEVAICIIGEYLNNKVVNIIGFISSIIPLCICPMILSKKPIRSIVGYALYIAFQAISVIIKGLAITKINSESTFVALIYGVDLYIMLTLFYLYSNLIKNKIQEKGDNNNG